MSYLTYPHRPVAIKATEQVIDRLYDAAFMGLKGDALAFAAGMTPGTYAKLTVNDPLVELAVQRGRADSERLHASKLHEASLAGDSKASLAILQHVHGWAAKHQVDMSVNANISITAALEDARIRVLEGISQRISNVEAEDNGTDRPHQRYDGGQRHLERHQVTVSQVGEDQSG